MRNLTPAIGRTAIIAAAALAAATGATLGSRGDQAAVDPREQDVRRLIDRYFTSWSSHDLERYAACFLPQAAVQLLNAEGRVATMPLRPFLKSQKLAHEQAPRPMTETPESIDVRFEARLARVVVRWKLDDGQGGDEGYDHFTLVDTPAGWRIANLIFYSDAPKKP